MKNATISIRKRVYPTVPLCQVWSAGHFSYGNVPPSTLSAIVNCCILFRNCHIIIIEIKSIYYHRNRVHLAEITTMKWPSISVVYVSGNFCIGRDTSAVLSHVILSTEKRSNHEVTEPFRRTSFSQQRKDIASLHRGAWPRLLSALTNEQSTIHYANWNIESW